MFFPSTHPTGALGSATVAGQGAAQLLVEQSDRRPVAMQLVHELGPQNPGASTFLRTRAVGSFGAYCFLPPSWSITTLAPHPGHSGAPEASPLNENDQDTLVDWLLIEPADGSGPLTQLLYVASIQKWQPNLIARRCRRFLASLSDTQ